jgi:hypothetical protein
MRDTRRSVAKTYDIVLFHRIMRSESRCSRCDKTEQSKVDDGDYGAATAVPAGGVVDAP